VYLSIGEEAILFLL